MSVQPYALSNPDSTDPLNNPSHSGLHVATNASLASLGTRVGTIETQLSTTAGDIEQARRVSNTWVIDGPVTNTSTLLLLPLIYNLTARQVKFEAAVASLLTAPSGGSITVDIVLGLTPESPPDPIATLVIQSGDNVSSVITGFSPPVMLTSQFVAVRVRTVGSATGASGLTVQLNRLL